MAATNRDLAQAVEEGHFREDLFTVSTWCALRCPLSQRREDLPVLVAHFVKKYAAEVGRSAPQVDRQAMELIYRHAWPGNVRELENAIERAVILAGDSITPADLPLEIRPEERSAASTELPQNMSINDAVEDLERRMIVRALKEAGGGGPRGRGPGAHQIQSGLQAQEVRDRLNPGHHHHYLTPIGPETPTPKTGVHLHPPPSCKQLFQIA